MFYCSLFNYDSISVHQGGIVQHSLLFHLDSDADNIKCYVHAVSPVKKSTKSNCRYFNFILQGKDNTARGVCFAPAKHSELSTLQKTKSPVKVCNYSQSNDDVIFNHVTKLTPLDGEDIDFPYSESISITGMIKNIASCYELASEQLLSIKAEVAVVLAVKKIHMQHQGTLEKQEIILRDNTGCIKGVLWGAHVYTLDQKSTYIFTNFKVMVFKGERYFNTPKGENFETKETTAFDQP